MLDDPQPVLEYMKRIADNPLGYASLLEEAEGKFLVLGWAALLAGTQQSSRWCGRTSQQLQREVTNTLDRCVLSMLCQDSPSSCPTCGGPPRPKIRRSVGSFSKNAKRYIDRIETVLDTPLSPEEEEKEDAPSLLVECIEEIATHPFRYAGHVQDCEGQLAGLAMLLIAAEIRLSLDEAAGVVADLIAEVTKDTPQPPSQVPLLCEDPILAPSWPARRLASKTFSKNAERFVARLKVFLESS